MKWLNSVLFALLMSWSAYSQTTITVTIPGNVATHEWVAERVKIKLDSLRASIPPCPVCPPVVICPEPVTVARPCPEGPTLLEVVSSSTTQLKIKFHGSGVNALDYSVTGVNLNDATETGTIKPTSATLTIKYNVKHHDGAFVLAIKGSSCTSAISSKFYTIQTATK